MANINSVVVVLVPPLNWITAALEKLNVVKNVPCRWISYSICKIKR